MMLSINVTQDDIDDGIPACPGRCPIAIAARRMLEKITNSCAFDIRVNHFFMNVIDNEEKIHHIRLPRSVKQFVYYYDKEQTRGSAKPFSFNIRVNETMIDDIASVTRV